MKKLFIYILISILITGMISCGDNELFSVLHELTPEEEAEIARQDSIAKAERERINANLILEYTLEITMSAAQYNGGAVTVEVDKIAQLFNITVDEFLAGMAGESGAPEIKGFAIDGSTHVDFATASNTNAAWGHWWDANGDVIGWGDNAMVAAEFDPTTGVFNIAQFPGHLTDGQTIKFIEALKYNDQRVAIVITITAVAPKKLEVEVVNTQNLTIDVMPMNSYDPEVLAFDLNQVLSDLGVSSMDETRFIGVNEDGSFAEEYSADPVGFWYDMNGFASTWGDNASVYVTYGAWDANQIGIGQYPGHLSAGQTLVLKFGIFANDKIVMLNITLNVVADGNGEATIVSTQKLSINVSPKSSYDPDALDFDLNQVLTDLGISSMDGVKFVGLNADGSVNTGYTADPPGFWYDMEGAVGSWGDNASVYTTYGGFEANQIGIGQYPDHLSADQTIVINYGIIANGKIAMFNITINVVGYVDSETAPAGIPEDLVIDVELKKAYSNDYASVTSDVKETLRNAFKMTTYQIHKAIASGELKLYQGEVGTADPAYTADVPGYWLKSDGAAGGWAESFVWCSIGHSETELYLYGGNHPDNGVAGSIISTKLIATCNGGSVTINLTFKVE